jgi:hypothetical protein
MLDMCLLGASWGHRGGFVGGLGSILELLRCAWGHLGGLGASWDVLGATLLRLGVDLGASWAIVDVLGVLLGVSWGCLGDSWGLLGASWGLLGEFGSSSCIVNMQKIKCTKTL